MLLTVSASAPSYVAVTSTTGGVMSGYCSTESCDIEIKPNITIVIAIEIANIGRVIKNFPIAATSFWEIP